MSAPASGTSSGAAQRGEEALMIGDDARDGRWIGRRVPPVDLERPAEDDAVGPREHVAGSTSEGILHLGLRLEDRELAAGGMQAGIAEQVAAAKARAVEDEAFGQDRDVGRSREPADLELAAGDEHVADHLAEIATGLDVHRVVAQRPRPRERMLGGAEHPVNRWEGGDRLRFGAIGLDIGWQPANAVIVADHDLVSAPAIV